MTTVPKGPPGVVRLGGGRRRLPEATAPLQSHLALFPPPSDWTVPEVAALPDVSLLDLVALDTETRDVDIKTHGPSWPWGGGWVCGVALWWGTGGGYYPLRQGDGAHDLTGEARATFERWLTALWTTPTVTLAMHHARYDLGWMGTLEATPRATLRAAVWDTMAAAALLNEYRPSYKLDDLAWTALGERKDESGLRAAAAAYGVDPKGGLWALPAPAVGRYAETDARLTWGLAARWRPDLAARGLEAIWALETALAVEVLWPMRARGIRVDLEGARALVARAADEAHRLRRAHIPVGVDIWGASCGRWLETLGHPLPRTATGHPSVTKEWLSAVGRADARVAAVARVRALEKLSQTFVEAYLLDKARDGRVYPEFHPLRSDEGGAVTGRFSSSHPNYQNLPRVRAADDTDDIGRIVRGLVLPEPGEEWVAADYSQQEPRLAVHYAEALGLPGAGALAEAYRRDPATDFYRLLTERAAITRAHAKALSLGRIYGMGERKMLATLGLEPPEGQAVLEAFDAAAPWIRGLARAVERAARDRGFIRTVGGRRCRVREDGTTALCVDRGGPVPMHKMLNRLIQGSAADQTKAAMVAAARAGLVEGLRVTVHDELGWSGPDDPEWRAAVRGAMEGAVALSVPSRVELKRGATWGAAR